MALVRNAGVEPRIIGYLKCPRRGCCSPNCSRVIAAHLILINRPIVVTPESVRLCRPSEKVTDLLPPQRGEFVKEDGEGAVDENGQQVATA